MDWHISVIIKQLEQIRLGVRKIDALNLPHLGNKMSAEMISLLKTDDDIIKIAQRLLDGVIPGTHWKDDMENLFEVKDLNEHLDEMIEERQEQEDLHRLHTNPTQEEIDEGEADHSSDENGPELDHCRVYNELCDELGLSGTWLTLNEFLRDVGYPTFTEDYPLDVDDLIEVLIEDLYHDVDQYRLFLSGEMDQSIGSPFTTIIGSLLERCGDSRADYKYSTDADYLGFPTQEGEAKFFDEEEKLEEEDDVETFRDVIKEAFTYLGDELKLPEEWKSDLNIEEYLKGLDFLELTEFYDEIEDEIEQQNEQLEERLDELRVKVRLIEVHLDDDEQLDIDDMDNYEIEDYIEENKELLEDKKIHKRSRDYFDEQAVLTECGQNDPNAAIEEIRYEQSKTDFCINPTAFKRLCQETVQDFLEREDYDFEPGFYEALQVASEDYLIRHFEAANQEALHAKRTHIQPSDMAISVRVTDKHL